LRGACDEAIPLSRQKLLGILVTHGDCFASLAMTFIFIGFRKAMMHALTA